MVKIILKEKIENLGDIGDIVQVKPGYNRNYLIPYGKAVLATKKNIIELNKQKEINKHKQILKKEQELVKIKEYKNIIEKILAYGDFIIQVPVVDDKTNKLFGSIGSKDISEFIYNNIGGISIDKKYISIIKNDKNSIYDDGKKDLVIKSLGEYYIFINLINKKVSCKIKTIICKSS